MQDLAHKILLVLTAITIIGEFASIILWTVNPRIPLGQARFSLAVDYTVAVASAAIFSVLNLIAFMLIFRRKKIGPIFLIAISVVNRGLSNVFFIGGVHFLFITWTILLIIFAALDYRIISRKT